MKWLIPAILSIVILLVPFNLNLSRMSYATPERPKIYVSPPTIKAVINETFSINVSIVDITNLWAYDLMLKYDNAALNCTAAEIPPGHFLDSNNTSIVKDGEIHQDEGYVLFNATLITPEEPRSGDGLLGTITFQVLKKGECPLEIYGVIFLGADGLISPEEYDVDHGYFVAFLYGDLNGDGVVNIADIAIVALAYHSKPGDPRWDPRADLDGNGITNIIDVAEVAGEFGKTA